MSHPKGKLIVIEGTDGSGKATQTQLLFARLTGMGVPTASMSFPQYEHKSSGLIAEYLNGTYGRPEEVSPYAASLFYALDRFDASSAIRAILREGRMMVLDRYVASNAGHQGGKIKNGRERAEFIAWLYDTEYRILGVPKPDITLILHVPAAMGQKLVAKKQARLYIEGGKSHDVHEGDLEHLKDAEAAYLWLQHQFPKEHRIIPCVKDGVLLSPEEIHANVWEEVAIIIGKKGENA